ncbi:MAG: HAD family phosphatase [Eggerthellaceae bacterium]|nr:HAD family phosphatase [Eggerthellaceae bacterium]
MNPLFKDASGFVFDCDGTLLDTMDAWNALEEDLFAQASIPFTPEQIDEIRALPIQMGAGRFYEHGIGNSPEHVLEILDTALLSFYQNEVCALPGAVDFVQAARAANIPCTVVSSSPQRYVVAGLKRADIADAFTAIVTTEDVSMSKQDPRIYLHAIEAMDAQAETSWGFDDALYALKVMRETGLRTCGCYDHDETGTYEQLADVADIAIRSFTELL